MTDLYFDFLCPYAWRGVEMAALLRGEGESFRLRHFSLVEQNHPDNAEKLTWHLSEQPLDAEGEGKLRGQRGSLNAFLSALAAAQQGEEAAWGYTLALFRAHHGNKEPLDEPAFEKAAQAAGLDLAAWQAARMDEETLRLALRRELDEARALGVFGTPTFRLPSGDTAYFRFEGQVRDASEARALWQLYTQVLASPVGVATIRRPTQPHQH
ncbi:DsbA family protein [Deinococcus lacus]|uniref:DsbA family protein n=1 Tax=Deinococcus lacus TaxID=392561 RepID=A0ABW1YFH1_9DEIO